MVEDNVADLVTRLKAGEDAAFSELVYSYGPKLLKHAEQFLRDPSEAQDCVQEVFIQAFRKINTFRGEAALATWLHRILINACLAHLRKRKTKDTLSIDALMPEFDWAGCRTEPLGEPLLQIDELIAQQEVREAVLLKIKQLPDPYRSVLLLRDIEGYSTREASEVLMVSIATVKVRLHRARAALKKHLEPTLLDVHT